MKPEEQKIKELKVGNIYNVRMRVLGINPKNREITTETVNELGSSLGFEPTYFSQGELPAFSPIAPENGKKNTAPAPKYDPCRMLKAGDIVKPKAVNGRFFIFGMEELIGQNCMVVEDEEKYDHVLIRHGEEDYAIDPAYLELVTPVEERVRYRVGDFPTNNEWCVWKDSLSKTEVVSSYKIDTHPHAKEAAEAERDRLNAEHRKENACKVDA